MTVIVTGAYISIKSWIYENHRSHTVSNHSDDNGRKEFADVRAKNTCLQNFMSTTKLVDEKRTCTLARKVLNTLNCVVDSLELRPRLI